MKEYDVVSSLTKALSLIMTYDLASRYGIPQVVGFTRSGKIVLEMDGGLSVRGS